MSNQPSSRRRGGARRLQLFQLIVITSIITGMSVALVVLIAMSRGDFMPSFGYLLYTLQLVKNLLNFGGNLSESGRKFSEIKTI